MSYKANENKALEVELNNKKYLRIPIKTHVVLKDDILKDVVTKYAQDLVEDGDHLFITEKIVAIMQGRAYALHDIKPRKLAVTLSNYVTKTPHGIGLGMPETMEMALREVGTPRILFAAGVSVITKLFGRSGDFYNVAGYKARSIDGPTSGTIPPYDKHVVLGPLHPKKVANEIRTFFDKDIQVSVVDINDLGGNILGQSDNTTFTNEELITILKDNPLGQGTESTPMGIIRKIA